MKAGPTGVYDPSCVKVDESRSAPEDAREEVN